MLRKSGVEQLYFTGIVTNGGVASTVRDAHVREFECTVVEDGCAAFSEDVHRAAIEGLRPVAKIQTMADIVKPLHSKDRAMSRMVLSVAALILQPQTLADAQDLPSALPPGRRRYRRASCVHLA